VRIIPYGLIVLSAWHAFDPAERCAKVLIVPPAILPWYERCLTCFVRETSMAGEHGTTAFEWSRRGISTPRRFEPDGGGEAAERGDVVYGTQPEGVRVTVGQR